MADLSNSLADLAERVKEATAASALAERTSTEKAIEAGSFLIEAKDQCKHGEWLPFLKRAGVHDRQARRLMQLARSGLDIGLVSDLGGIGAALAWLGSWSLPNPGETLVVSLDDFSPSGTAPAAFIWTEGHGYHVALLDLNEASPHAICTIQPVNDARAARLTLFRVIDFRVKDASFCMLADKHFDPEFLEGLRLDIVARRMDA